MAVRWRRFFTKNTSGDSVDVAVNDWKRVLAAGTTRTDPGEEAVYSANWSDFSAAEAVRWMIDPFGWVHIQGACKSAIAIVTPVTMFNLPVAARPLQSIDFITPCAVVNASYNHIGINVAGNVAVFGSSAVADTKTGVHVAFSFRAPTDQVPQ